MIDLGPHRPLGRQPTAQPVGEGLLVSCAEIAALSRLAGTGFAISTPLPVGTAPVLHGSYVMTALRSGVVVHATDTRDLHDLTSQVVHSVFEYVRKRRLERARDALVAEAISVTEAATNAGYTSSANFSTAFKRAFGVPPKSMR